jgi:hypothetical protein
LTKDDRTAFYGLVQAFVPNLTQSLDPARLVDDTVFTLVSEAMAQLDAELLDLRQQADELRSALARANDGAVIDPPSGRCAAVVPEAQVDALLRHHRIMFGEVLQEGYTDKYGIARVRPKMVPRPARAGDVIGCRDNGEAVVVVLGDGKRHVLPYADSEVV